MIKKINRFVKRLDIASHDTATRQRPPPTTQDTSRVLLDTCSRFYSFYCRTPHRFRFPFLPPSLAALSHPTLATAASAQGGEEGPVCDAPVLREAEDLR